MLFSREQHQSSGTRADMVSSIEADAVLARAQNATALARCVGFIEAGVGRHGVLLRSATEAAAASHDSTIPRHLPSILFTLPQQQLAIEALDEASVQRCRHTLWALLLTSRRDIRIRCIEALVRGGGDEELAWLRMHRTQEPCPSVLAAIPE